MPRRVVVVDDSKLMRNMLKKVLLPNECEIVAEGADGIEAIKLYQQHKPDVIFMDITMPNKNGVDALEGIKLLDPEAKVILCTSVKQPKVLSKAESLGVLTILSKPAKDIEFMKLILDQYVPL